jgi:hypothetical protein
VRGFGLGSPGFVAAGGSAEKLSPVPLSGSGSGSPVDVSGSAAESGGAI